MSPVPHPRYEVVFALDGGEDAAHRLRLAWDGRGDEVAVRAADGAWICHVHTDDIGAVIEAALPIGRPREITVTDLLERPGDPEFHDGVGIETGRTVEAAVAPLGVVAVADGQGVITRFRQAHAQSVVVAGPSRPARLDDLVAAVDASPAPSILLLPNDSRLVALAESVGAVSPKSVAVVPTRSVQQGLAAMMGYSLRETDLETAAEEMSAAASSIVDGAVTRASRDSLVPFGAIARGDWVGVADGTVVVADPDLETTLRQLVAGIWLAGTERVTVLTGEGALPAATKALDAWIADVHTGTEVVLVEGGQSGSPYLVSIE